MVSSKKLYVEIMKKRSERDVFCKKSGPK